MYVTVLDCPTARPSDDSSEDTPPARSFPDSPRSAPLLKARLPSSRDLLLGIDCDLHKIYAVDSRGTKVCQKFPTTGAIEMWAESNPDGLLLFEVGSPVIFREGKGAVHQTCRWLLWNMAQAQRLSLLFPDRVYVSPSTKWTLGHGIKVRHEAAECRQTEKNMREAEAMIFFYQHNPEQWCTLAEFLEDV